MPPGTVARIPRGSVAVDLGRGGPPFPPEPRTLLPFPVPAPSKATAPRQLLIAYDQLAHLRVQALLRANDVKLLARSLNVSSKEEAPEVREQLAAALAAHTEAVRDANDSCMYFYRLGYRLEALARAEAAASASHSCRGRNRSRSTQRGSR